MSKKILKRSLALGALMAFVITGNVMANDVFWNGENELKQSITNGKAVANVQDTETAGKNVAYLVVGSDENVNADIEVNANYNHNVPTQGAVAAILLNGNDQQDVKKATIEGDVNYNIKGSSSSTTTLNQGVFLQKNAVYIQKGNLNMSMNNSDNIDCNIITLRVGKNAGEDNSFAVLNGDINVRMENLTADVLNIVRVAGDSEIVHNGNVNLFAKNFAGTEADHEGISGLWCRDGGIATLIGDINMTFINDGQADKKYLNVNNIYGAGLHIDGTINHTGNIDMNFGGKPSDLFNAEQESYWGTIYNQGTIYAYINHVGTYNASENNVNTISFGTVDDNGEKVAFISNDNDSLKWSFAHFDVMNVTEGSSFYIDNNQREGYYLCGWYFLGQNKDDWYEIDDTKIHSDGGKLYLGSNTLILENKASATMNELNTNGAKISIGEGAKLNINGNLNGNATFALANLDADQVLVQEEAKGRYVAEISVGDLEEGTNISEVAMDKNGSIFDDVVGVADEVYESGSADIDENGNLVNVKKTIDSANVSVNDMAAVGLMSWRAEMNDMNKRMGELRNANGDLGVWVRMVRGESEYNSVKNQYNQYQLGYDEKLSVDKRWTVGVALSYTDAENSFVQGNGESTNKALSIYGSKLNDDGTFIDLIAKYARLENDYTAYSGQGNGEYDTNGYSFSAEVGKRIEQGKGLWIEPQVELTYGKVSSVDYVTANGVNVAQDGMESLVGRVGFSLGKDVKGGNVYARASYLYDFEGETQATLDNDAVLKQDLGGGWWEVGVGANINLSKATYIYADIEKTFGGEVDTNWQWNLGVRYSF